MNAFIRGRSAGGGQQILEVRSLTRGVRPQVLRQFGVLEHRHR